MDEFKFFKTFKERGEWIEMRFMAEAMRHGYKVLMPWGDSQPFDVAICFGSRIVRVQVKSTTCRAGTGYHCEFERSSPKSSYTLKQVDFFAVCVITENAWYLIPARALLNGDRLKKGCDAMSHAADEGKSLPLRVLPRSLAPAAPEVGGKRAPEGRQIIAQSLP